VSEIRQRQKRMEKAQRTMLDGTRRHELAVGWQDDK
jgi:hypothetical protein